MTANSIVVFDREETWAWLWSERTPGESEAEAAGVDGAEGITPELLARLDDLLSNGPRGWSVRPDVENVGIWPTLEGAVITLNVVGFPRVASLWQDAKEFSRQRGVEATLDALARVADVVNELGREIDKVRG